MGHADGLCSRLALLGSFTLFPGLPRFSVHSVPTVRCSWGLAISFSLPVRAEMGSPPFLVPSPEHGAWQPASIKYSFPVPGVWESWAESSSSLALGAGNMQKPGAWGMGTGDGSPR